MSRIVPDARNGGVRKIASGVVRPDRVVRVEAVGAAYWCDVGVVGGAVVDIVERLLVSHVRFGIAKVQIIAHYARVVGRSVPRKYAVELIVRVVNNGEALRN